ncbi:hypothetical protein AOZ06_28840 [Kibdelosporangium phytohabitans]|uniref:HTH luxR-type domain-containing protein n=1 Tax=Kibdelosporangium phytohabitans TaxID=860235 RepID=A0A0N9I792_9PSEU|nr:hypothetical protein AOZ06_28840 [Kibdelosporangium phytohabitans]
MHAVIATDRPLVLVTGPSGIGRTTFLGRAEEHLSKQGKRVSVIRFTRGGDAVAVRLGGPDSVHSLIGPVAGAQREVEVARRAAAVAANSLLGGDHQAALLVDDAQWIDDDSLAVLEALVRRLAGTSAVCVCTVRTPVTQVDRIDWARKLRDEGLLRSVRLRPMTAAEISRRLTAVTLAKPDDELVTRVGQLSLGVPAAVRDSIETLWRTGAIQVFGNRAYLVASTQAVDAPQNNEFVRVIRGLGQRAHAVAKAVSVLAPFGTDVPRLVAASLGMAEPDVVVLLEALVREGILHRGRRGSSWRFPVPLVASALVAGMGPFERRRLAAKAVDAVWAGEVRCADVDYLTDLVADAGRLVDPQRALDELLRRSAETGSQATERAVHWLGAAIELANSRIPRVRAMLAHTAACHALGDYERGLRGALLLLNDFADQLTPDETQEVHVIAVHALKGVRDTEALREIAGLRRRWPGDDTVGIVTRALAYSMLDCWIAVRDLLTRTEDLWRSGNPTSVFHGSRLSTMAALWTGRVEPFEHCLADPAQWPMPDGPRFRIEQVNSCATALLVTGDTCRAEKLLIDEDLPVASVRLGNRALLAAMVGRVDLAVELVTRGIVSGTGHGPDAGSAAMYLNVVEVLVAQGKLTAAREMMLTAREGDLVLGHLLDIAEARIDRALGENGRAAAKLRHCLDKTGQGLLIGADLCLSELADVALEADDRQEARRCLAEIERLAESMPTSRVLTQAQLVRACVYRSRQAADDSLRLARERGQPLELATTATRLVQHGAAEPTLLSEVYDLLGELGALLYRSWIRNLMREHGVVVPGRRETVAENERVLAMLAADGLTNKQLGMALRTSEKSVEGRLSRLFARTGYRSRIELSTAMLTGEF